MPHNAHHVAGVLLAAGESARLGGGKLLLPWRGMPLIAHSVRAATRAQGLSSLAVVLGHDAGSVRRAVAEAAPNPPFSVHCTVNRCWGEGMSSSLRCGLEYLLAAQDAGNIAGVMFLLADQPLVISRTLTTLLRAHLGARAKNPDHPATAPAYRGRRGNPVILSPNLFPEVMALSGDTGARRILENLGDRLLLTAVDDPGILYDVDTPEAYAALLALKEGTF